MLQEGGEDEVVLESREGTSEAYLHGLEEGVAQMQGQWRSEVQ